jgi:hypothetical protein
MTLYLLMTWMKCRLDRCRLLSRHSKDIRKRGNSDKNVEWLSYVPLWGLHPMQGYCGITRVVCEANNIFFLYRSLCHLKSYIEYT